MGGDHAPSAVVEGSARALARSSDSLSIVLTGDEEAIRRELGRIGFSSPRLVIHPTTQIVQMTDRPSQVVATKPDSSLVAGIRLVKEGIADGFVSAGSTGAVLAASLMLLERIPGVKRPALGAYIPARPSGVMLCDVGANIDVKPDYLLQFAIMASEYMRRVYHVAEPRIGLLNVGSESTKGQKVYVETHELFAKYLPTFAGNIEARYVLDGKVDVVVCDGFVGNNLLKFAEGFVVHLAARIAEGVKRFGDFDPASQKMTSLLRNVMREFDYEEYGGVPLLGVNGVCMVSHGSSGPRAMENSILAAFEAVQSNLVPSIREDITASVRAVEEAT